jgi:DNA-binding CsgD family transcriptional regulator/catechol 2,3-dioxygenase-like lactoylglutathione lyase family enzyme
MPPASVKLKSMTSHGKRGRPPYADLLTPAEWRVVEAVRHGMTNPGIARRQGISVDAVKYHVANALQKLGFTSRAQLRHWRGIRRDSKLYARELNMAKPCILGPIGQIARSVRDVAAARQWYGEVLGLQHLYSFGKLAFFDCGGLRLFLSEGEGAAADSIIYFRVDDIRSAHVALEARGVEFTHAPHMIHRHDDGTEEWMAFFKDNENRPLAIMAAVSG